MYAYTEIIILFYVGIIRCTYVFDTFPKYFSNSFNFNYIYAFKNSRWNLQNAF